MAQHQKGHVAMSLIHSSLVQRSHRAVGATYKNRAAASCSWGKEPLAQWTAQGHSLRAVIIGR